MAVQGHFAMAVQGHFAMAVQGHFAMAVPPKGALCATALRRFTLVQRIV
jgi:hypothetical protein